MKFLYKISSKRWFLGCALLVSTGLFAQTNPTPQTIPYSQNFSTLTHASTTFPAGWQGWKVSSAATNTYQTVAATGDQALIASSSASNNSGGVHNYNGKIGELPSGSTNPAIALALVTTGSSNIKVTYDIMVIRNPYDGAANNRINEATLQYRVGTSGAFTTLTGIEYQSGTTAQTASGVTTPQNPQTKSITLPSACDNQAVVQIRWIVKDVSGGGSRPSFAVDNVSVDADNDNDTYVSSVDCNDNNVSIYPGATEVCNFIDDDCDATADNGITYLAVYDDADGDTYGNGLAANYCTFPGAGYSLDNTDCDDTNGSVNPGATEVCNGVDDDCNGTPDDGLTFETYYADADGDTHGDAAVTTTTCDGAPMGYVSNSDDCNDSDDSIYPGAIDLCNGIDNDCDGNIDEDALFTTYYVDNDGDTYGDQLDGGTTFCYVPAAPYVLDNTDCNDADASINPGASEICNAMDEDCDGIADDGLTFDTYYADADGDTHGDAAVATTTCDGAPMGYVSNSDDCDDADDTVYPGVIDLCNGIDNDCDGNIDDDALFTTYYLDNDGDTYGDQLDGGTTFCYVPAAPYVLDNTDCNDADASINPGASEICNAMDEDCDGVEDDGLTFTTYYKDNDGDGFGDGTYGTATTCDGAPATYVADNTDCEDFNDAINPAAIEVCNFIDDNCSGISDEGLPIFTFYQDADGDNFGNPLATLEACGPYGAMWISNNEDCDDTNDAVYPGATEICDGLDNNCDGNVDDGIVTATISPSGVVVTCKGVPQTFTANTGIGYTYQWFKNGNIIVGATNSTYSSNKPANYQVQVNTPEGCFALSEPTGLGVSPNPNANISAPNGLNMCLATVKLKASFGATYAYQWYLGGSPISGATNFTYFPVATGNYSCEITNEFNCSRTTATVTVINVCREGLSAEPVENNTTLAVYPNPADNLFNVEMELDELNTDATVTVFNILGEVVYNAQVALFNGTLNTTVDASSFTSGAYIVSVSVNGKMYTTNLMITE